MSVNILQNRNLLRMFIMRDSQAHYKNTWVGLLWLAIQPIMMLTIYTLVFQHILGVIQALSTTLRNRLGQDLFGEITPRFAQEGHKMAIPVGQRVIATFYFTTSLPPNGQHAMACDQIRQRADHG